MCNKSGAFAEKYFSSKPLRCVSSRVREAAAAAAALLGCGAAISADGGNPLGGETTKLPTMQLCPQRPRCLDVPAPSHAVSVLFRKISSDNSEPALCFVSARLHIRLLPHFFFSLSLLEILYLS